MENRPKKILHFLINKQSFKSIEKKLQKMMSHLSLFSNDVHPFPFALIQIKLFEIQVISR